MTRPLRSLGAALATFALAAAQEGAPEPAAELVFRSDRGGGRNGLYRMQASGGQVRQLVANDRDVLHFAVHPSGRQLAYVCDPSDTEMFELWVLDLETGAQRAVQRGIRFHPVWSRDGSRLAFMHHALGWRIRLTDPDVVVARPEQDHVGGDGAPSWFPDGRRIVLQSNRTGALELFVADTATGAATQLTATARAEASPAVSPDGRWIAFRAGVELWLMAADGSGARRLSPEGARTSGHTWSTDSGRIAFAMGRDGETDVCTVAIAGEAPLRRLTGHAAADDSPAWSPDGRQLAFVSERDGDPEIYLIGADGDGLVRVTHATSRDRSPAWLAPRR